jgi:hypothetical protein
VTKVLLQCRAPTLAALVIWNLHLASHLIPKEQSRDETNVD